MFKALYQDFQLRKVKRILRKINALKGKMESLSDQELAAKTIEFRQRLAKGETVDDLLVEAFAVVREADKRVLGMFPYDVQVMGGIVIHQGNVAEMNTGEGKTLTATMPVYLNALTGKGTMLITTNDYLAKRDAEEMGQVYRFLGLTIGVPLTDDPKEELTSEEKKRIYASDIIYTTNSNLGFDYLMIIWPQMRKENFCVLLITLLLTRLMISYWTALRHLLLLRELRVFSLITTVLLIRW